MPEPVCAPPERPARAGGEAFSPPASPPASREERTPGLASFSDVLDLPIQSLRSVAMSSATACSSRTTSNRCSGAVGTSSTSMSLSKNTMFSGRVRMMRRFVRSSAMIATLPRRMPLAASATSEATLSGVEGPASSSRSRSRLRNVTPGGSCRRWIPGEPELRDSVAVAALEEEELSSPFASFTTSSSRALTSAALANRIGRMFGSSRATTGLSM